jgi:oxygen-independent coproporphyrinogen-3 oxidase
LYQLTIEPNTFFHHQPPSLPDEDTLWDIQEEGKKYLTAAQFQQYEVSAYAQKNHECQHNLNYWEFGDYLGIGAGAHSKITHFDKQIITRHWQVKNPKDYLQKENTFTAQHIQLTQKDVIFEFMLNALRLSQGCTAELFTARTGLPLAILEPILTIAKEKKLLIDDSSILCATPLGQRFLNNVIEMFLPTRLHY